MSRDPRVDAYLERKAAFACPILAELRERVHAACPAAEETIRWGMPFFIYKGRPLANMAAFKEHASFGFWSGTSVTGVAREGMGSLGKLRVLADLPDADSFAGLVARAMALIDQGAKPPRTGKSRASATIPADLAAALAERDGAPARFAAFPPSAQRDYVEWIEEAKRPATRARRIAEAAQWIADGKRRNWKYET